MKQAVLIAVSFLLLLFLCGCETEGTVESMTNQNTESISVCSQTVTVISGVTEADVWLIPDTQANRATSLWGTATASGVKPGEIRPVPLCEPGDNGCYLLRVIDVDGFYYSANGVTLNDGWRLEIKAGDANAVTAEVTDENGVLQHTYEVFSARL